MIINFSESRHCWGARWAKKKKKKKIGNYVSYLFRGEAADIGSIFNRNAQTMINEIFTPNVSEGFHKSPERHLARAESLAAEND